MEYWTEQRIHSKEVWLSMFSRQPRVVINKISDEVLKLYENNPISSMAKDHTKAKRKRKPKKKECKRKKKKMRRIIQMDSSDDSNEDTFEPTLTKDDSKKTGPEDGILIPFRDLTSNNVVLVNPHTDNSSRINAKTKDLGDEDVVKTVQVPTKEDFGKGDIAHLTATRENNENCSESQVLTNRTAKELEGRSRKEFKYVAVVATPTVPDKVSKAEKPVSLTSAQVPVRKEFSDEISQAQKPVPTRKEFEGSKQTPLNLPKPNWLSATSDPRLQRPHEAKQALNSQPTVPCRKELVSKSSAIKSGSTPHGPHKKDLPAAKSVTFSEPNPTSPKNPDRTINKTFVQKPLPAKPDAQPKIDLVGAILGRMTDPPKITKNPKVQHVTPSAVEPGVENPMNYVPPLSGGDLREDGTPKAKDLIMQLWQSAAVPHHKTVKPDPKGYKNLQTKSEAEKRYAKSIKEKIAQSKANRVDFDQAYSTSNLKPPTSPNDTSSRSPTYPVSRNYHEQTLPNCDKATTSDNTSMPKVPQPTKHTAVSSPSLVNDKSGNSKPNVTNKNSPSSPQIKDKSALTNPNKSSEPAKSNAEPSRKKLNSDVRKNKSVISDNGKLNDEVPKMNAATKPAKHPEDIRSATVQPVNANSEPKSDSANPNKRGIQDATDGCFAQVLNVPIDSSLAAPKRKRRSYVKNSTKPILQKLGVADNESSTVVAKIITERKRSSTSSTRDSLETTTNPKARNTSSETFPINSKSYENDAKKARLDDTGHNNPQHWKKRHSLLQSEDPVMPEETQPIPKETRHIPKETRPNPKETRPNPTETRPILKVTRPVSKETRPVPKEARPVPKETRPVPKEIRHIDREIRPIPNEIRPILKDIQPTPYQNMPIITDTTIIFAQVLVPDPAPLTSTDNSNPPDDLTDINANVNVIDEISKDPQTSGNMGLTFTEDGTCEESTVEEAEPQFLISAVTTLSNQDYESMSTPPSLQSTDTESAAIVNRAVDVEEVPSTPVTIKTEPECDGATLANAEIFKPDENKTLQVSLLQTNRELLKNAQFKYNNMIALAGTPSEALELQRKNVETIQQYIRYLEADLIPENEHETKEAEYERLQQKLGIAYDEMLDFVKSVKDREDELGNSDLATLNEMLSKFFDIKESFRLLRGEFEESDIAVQEDLDSTFAELYKITDYYIANLKDLIDQFDEPEIICIDSPKMEPTADDKAKSGCVVNEPQLCPAQVVEVQMTEDVKPLSLTPVQTVPIEPPQPVELMVKEPAVKEPICPILQPAHITVTPPPAETCTTPVVESPNVTITPPLSLLQLALNEASIDESDVANDLHADNNNYSSSENPLLYPNQLQKENIPRDQIAVIQPSDPPVSSVASFNSNSNILSTIQPAPEQTNALVRIVERLLIVSANNALVERGGAGSSVATQNHPGNGNPVFPNTVRDIYQELVRIKNLLATNRNADEEDEEIWRQVVNCFQAQPAPARIPNQVDEPTSGVQEHRIFQLATCLYKLALWKGYLTLTPETKRSMLLIWCTAVNDERKRVKSRGSQMMKVPNVGMVELSQQRPRQTILDQQQQMFQNMQNRPNPQAPSEIAQQIQYHAAQQKQQAVQQANQAQAIPNVPHPSRVPVISNNPSRSLTRQPSSTQTLSSLNYSRQQIQRSNNPMLQQRPVTSQQLSPNNQNNVQIVPSPDLFGNLQQRTTGHQKRSTEGQTHHVQSSLQANRQAQHYERQTQQPGPSRLPQDIFQTLNSMCQQPTQQSSQYMQTIPGQNPQYLHPSAQALQYTQSSQLQTNAQALQYPHNSQSQTSAQALQYTQSSQSQPSLHYLQNPQAQVNLQQAPNIQQNLQAQRLQREQAMQHAQRQEQAQRIQQEQAILHAQKLQQEQAILHAQKLQQEQAILHAQKLQQEQAILQAQKLRQEQQRIQAQKFQLNQSSQFQSPANRFNTAQYPQSSQQALGKNHHEAYNQQAPTVQSPNQLQGQQFQTAQSNTTGETLSLTEQLKWVGSVMANENNKMSQLNSRPNLPAQQIATVKPMAKITTPPNPTVIQRSPQPTPNPYLEQQNARLKQTSRANPQYQNSRNPSPPSITSPGRQYATTAGASPPVGHRTTPSPSANNPRAQPAQTYVRTDSGYTRYTNFVQNSQPNPIQARSSQVPSHRRPRSPLIVNQFHITVEGPRHERLSEEFSNTLPPPYASLNEQHHQQYRPQENNQPPQFQHPITALPEWHKPQQNDSDRSGGTQDQSGPSQM